MRTKEIESRYQSYAPDRPGRLELDFTPKRGSWLNIAEIEFGTLRGQRPNRRIPDLAEMRQQPHAWAQDRNNRQPKVNWLVTTRDARIKLNSIYPKLCWYEVLARQGLDV